MSKTSNSIKMLQILNSGRLYKISELAELLETNPRNISEYKKELEDCGYIINSISGKYGGYYLDKSILIPTIALSEKEQNIYNEGLNYLLSRDDFLTKKEYINAASKISSKLSTAALFSILAYTKASLPSFFTNSLTSLTRSFLIWSSYPLGLSCCHLLPRTLLLIDCYVIK